MTSTSDLIHIDGSRGEGGGQILRTSLTLSVVTGRPVRISRIRAGRPKPGLMRQHLACVNAAATISGGTVEGAEVGSKEVTLRPGGQILGGGTGYHFSVGTAGSTMLVLQTVLPALMFANAPTRVAIEGGTHTSNAPTPEFIQRAFLPLIERMGPRVDLRVERRGFYPAGGGLIVAEIQPCPRDRLGTINLHDRGTPGHASAEALLSRLGDSIARRELAVLREHLTIAPEHAAVVHEDQPRGPGNAVVLTLRGEHVTEVFSSIGAIGRSAETVSNDAVNEARDYLRIGAPVGPHLADQLLLPMALAAWSARDPGAAGSFTTGPLTEHSRTNIETIRCFLDVPIVTNEQDDRVRVSIGG